MAQIFGIEESEFNDLPDVIKKSLQAAEAKQNENSELKTKLEAIEAKLNGNGNQNGGGQNNGNGNQNGGNGNATPWANKYSAADILLFDTRRDQLLNKLSNGADKSRAMCIKKYGAELDKIFESNDPAFTANEAWLCNAIDVVAGRHLQEILNAVRANDTSFNEFFTEGASGGNAGGGGKPKSASEQLSPEELRVAKACGLTPEAYLESLNELRSNK